MKETLELIENYFGTIILIFIILGFIGDWVIDLVRELKRKQ